MSYANGKGQFRKGESGNPKGRPRGRRSLASNLIDRSQQNDYSVLTNGQVLARYVWHGLMFAEIDMGGDRHFKLDFKEWLELVKWAHHHTDGILNYGGQAEEPGAEHEPEVVIELPPELGGRDHFETEDVRRPEYLMSGPDEGFDLWEREATLREMRKWYEEHPLEPYPGGGGNGNGTALTPVTS